MTISLAGIALIALTATNPAPTPTFPAYHLGSEVYDPHPAPVARWFRQQQLVRCFPYLADALWGANITPPDAPAMARAGIAQFILDTPLDPQSKIASIRSGNGVRSVEMLREGNALAYEGGSRFPPSPTFATHIVTGVLSIDPSGIPAGIFSGPLRGTFANQLGTTLSKHFIGPFGSGHQACGFTARTVLVEGKMLAVTVIVDAGQKVVAVVNDEWS